MPTEAEFGIFAFRSDPTCDGMGPVTLYIDNVLQGSFILGNSGEKQFIVPIGFHSGRAQEMQDRLLYFDTLGAEVREDQPVTILLKCPK